MFLQSMKSVCLVMFILFGISGICSADVIKHDPKFDRDPYHWNTQRYWGGTLVRENNMLKLTPTKHSGKVWGQIIGSHCRQLNYFPGMVLRVTLEAKGSGKLTGGIISYLYPGPDGKKTKYLMLTDKSVELTPDVKQYVFEIVLDELPMRVVPFIRLDGTEPAYIKSFKLENVIRNGAVVKPVFKHQIIPESGIPGAVTFHSNQKNTKIGFYVKDLNKKLYFARSGQTDDAGNATFQPCRLPKGEYQMTAVVNGATVAGYVDVISDAEFAEMDAIAKRVKTDRPISVLIIGDSLSDYFRGRNYVDKIDFWLNRYNPGKFMIHNAGVGGDLLERVESRLLGIKGGKPAYRQNMYKNLFDKKYDLIFIFLGQNDTYVTNEGNYDNPKTPIVKHKPTLLRILKILRQNSDAQIVLISPSPSNEELSHAMYKKWGRARIGKFGSPRHVNIFDATNREVCREQNLEYIDILNPMRKYPDQKALFIPDGVHLSTIGAQVIAKEVVTWFAGKYK